MLGSALEPGLGVLFYAPQGMLLCSWSCEPPACTNCFLGAVLSPDVLSLYCLFYSKRLLSQPGLFVMTLVRKAYLFFPVKFRVLTLTGPFVSLCEFEASHILLLGPPSFSLRAHEISEAGSTLFFS